ncbi:MAG TPA: class I SAM-dependent methyltransferase [Methylomirabilota bacterium]|nr:class I SAM-dependent methyltransferase [Methylomirabilota bacterium]
MLDIGCGAAGHIGRFVADLGPRVVGVDLSPRSASLAARHNTALGFLAADMRALPFATGAGGGIVAFYSLIYEADPRGALRELRRVLTVGAPLLVAVHGGEGAHHFDSYKGMAIDLVLHLREPETFAEQVRRAGFAVDALEVREPYPFEHATPRVYISGRAA